MLEDRTGAGGSQRIMSRVACSMDGFEEADIVRLNSHPLPRRTWTYSRKNGICRGENQRPCVRGFAHFHKGPVLFTARPLKTAFCMVHKAASTVMRTLACLLDDPLAFFFNEMDLIRDAFDKSHCTSFGPNVIQEVKLRKLDRNMSTERHEWAFVSVVREPLDRFLSGYIHLCLYGRENNCQHYCNNCGANLTCFLEREIVKLRRMAKEGRAADAMTTHLRPQTFFCDLETHFKNYTFLRYSSDSRVFFEEELRPFLAARNVSSIALDYIGRKLAAERTQHATSDFQLKPFLAKRILKNSYLLDLFLRIYLDDYVAFNFPLPPIPRQ
ncbi:hypothetical protein M3Y99_00901100 [Aphelenchoides fujianensis]|nr:hypothetical protein M3Y99_00901100 [Aphelenchoides fujianensis]